MRRAEVASFILSQRSSKVPARMPKIGHANEKRPCAQLTPTTPYPDCLANSGIAVRKAPLSKASRLTVRQK